MCDELMDKNIDYLLTETRIRHTAEPEVVFTTLRANHTSGSLTFFLKDGGVRNILLLEKTKAGEAQREKIREILNMP